MPSFYPRSLPRQLPLTPPEFVPSYNTNANNGCGGMQYQQAYGGPAAVVHHEEGAYFAERYDHPVIPSGPAHSAVVFPQQAHFGPNSAVLPPPPSYFELPGAPLLPPMRVQERASMNDMEMHRRNQEQQARAQQKAREEKPTGGVSSELDYDMDIMSEFVAEMAQRIVQPDHPLQLPTRKWVHSVLSATRLPSSTILLGFHYMSRRMAMLQQVNQARGLDVQLTRMITLGLLLGSKFLDDNTFINRSWAEVSGINVQDLNRMEKDWLAAFEFRLHVDPSEPQGFNTWKGQWKEYEAQAVARATRQAKLSPIDTSVHVHHTINQVVNKSFAAPFAHAFGKLPTPEYTQKPQLSQQYNTPAYSHYDHAWGMPRSATETSPASTATLTGPTTPEYYGAHNVWGPPEGYSRRTMFGFPPVSQSQMHAQHQHMGFGSSCYSNQYHHQSVWNNHGMHCNCFQCVRQHPPYMMAAGFGPQAVAS